MKNELGWDDDQYAVECFLVKDKEGNICVLADFSVRTADLKNGFGLQTEFGRDDYVNDVVEKITRIVNG